MSVKILSLGCGVNSTAILCLIRKGKVKADLAIFADTGGEHPETYHYLENIIKPYCRKIPLELVIVKSDKPPLYDFYFSRKIIPTRIFRHCTDHYKIQPIKRYIMKNFPNKNVIFLIGYSAEEKHRVKNHCDNNYEYPLIELGIDREQCKQIIENEGLPLPRKSGCFFCPFTPKQGWLNLLQKHRELYLKAEALEKNNQRYPELTLTNVPLEKLRLNKELQRSLCDFGMESCPFCEVGCEAEK